MKHVALRASRIARSAVAERRAATVLEFALVVAPFFALLMAVLQTSLIYFAQEAIETSVEVAARSIITGQAQASDSAGSTSGLTAAQLQERFRTTACASLPGYMTCKNLLVDVRSATSWGSMDTSLPKLTFDANGNPTNSFSYSLGSQGAVVMVRLMYLWPIQAAPMQLNLANAGNGQRLIVATSVAKTESY